MLLHKLVCAVFAPSMIAESRPSVFTASAEFAECRAQRQIEILKQSFNVLQLLHA